MGATLTIHRVKKVVKEKPYELSSGCKVQHISIYTTSRDYFEIILFFDGGEDEKEL